MAILPPPLNLKKEKNIYIYLIIIIQFNSIIYVPSQQQNSQLQTQYNLNAGIYIIEK
jgi:hypothetical protein